MRSTLLRVSATLLALLTPCLVCAENEPVTPVDFVHEVVPILKRHCVTCHGGREQEGDFSINSRPQVLESGAVDLQDPAASRLLQLVTSQDPNDQMPPSDRPRVSQSEVAVLRRWVEQQLPWDEDFTFAVTSYEPPLKPRSPELPPASQGRTHPVDRILDAYLSEHDLPRPEPVDDSTFLRRAYLDLVGLLPPVERVETFLADQSTDKRRRLIDELLANDIDYADHWLTFFNDLLRNDYSGTGFITGGRQQISKWLYESLLENKPFDQFAEELIAPSTPASRGYIDGIKWRGEVSAGQTLPIQFAQSVSQSFLGINLKCASCHDSFIDRWTLQEAYGMAAIYSEAPLELHRCDKPTGETAQAAWLFPELGSIDAQASPEERLRRLASLMTHPENGRFTRTIVNRLWYRLMGRGIVHPLDAMQHEPWNADLLDYLAVHLADNDYDLKATLRLIATSQAYQSQTEAVAEEAPGEYVYRGPRARRLTAEQFLDCVWQLTGTAPKTFDAPIFRSDVDEQSINSLNLVGHWIWGSLQNNTAPGGEQVLLRKTFDLPAKVESAGAIVTCDNSYQMFVKRREVAAGDDWTKVQSVVLTSQLQQGANELIVVASNAGSEPNPAGLYVEARILLEGGEAITIATDKTWEWHAGSPTLKEGRINPPAKGWQPVTVATPVEAWTQVIQTEGKRLLATALAGDEQDRMVRASLLKNTAFMQSLGRPLREQIVSMRPTTLTTLEAIDLANEPSLVQAFASGAQQLLLHEWKSPDELTNHLFRSALTRAPSEEERRLFGAALGADPDAETLQDALWAICMLPEFLLVR